MADADQLPEADQTSSPAHKEQAAQEVVALEGAAADGSKEPAAKKAKHKHKHKHKSHKSKEKKKSKEQGAAAGSPPADDAARDDAAAAEIAAVPQPAPDAAADTGAPDKLAACSAAVSALMITCSAPMLRCYDALAV